MKAVQTICIIDDDDIYRFVARNTIQKFSSLIESTFYTNGETAISAFKKALSDNLKLPNIILLDINMPIMDGWEFMEAFNKLDFSLTKDVYIYITSSSLDISDIKRTEGIPHIKGFIHKPLTNETLFKITQKKEL